MNNKKIERVYTIPRMGGYTDIFLNAMRAFGLKTVQSYFVNSETIKLGVRNSVEMMCFPFKATLGSLIKTIGRKKVTDIIIYSTEGPCRYKHYGHLYQLALSNLGYDININLIRKGHVFSDLKKLTGCSYFKIWKVFKNTVKEVENYEINIGVNLIRRISQKFAFTGYDNVIDILIIGEVYSLLEPESNFNLRKKLADMGVKTIMPITLSSFIQHDVKNKDIKLDTINKYLNGETGGHGKHSVTDVVENINKVDGILHVTPLTCMPEVLVMPVIEHICRKHNKPMMKIEIDDSSSPLNLNTRLEAFIKTIRRSKCL